MGPVDEKPDEQPRDEVRHAVVDGVATITMDRQTNRNALTAELVNAVGDGLRRADGDDDVRVVVLTNEGNAFCAGADLKGTSVEEPRYTLTALLGLLQDLATPVVGRIAGHCTGGGVGLAAACDLSVAHDDVTLGFTEVRLGVVPAVISVVCLPKLRRSDALELFLTGERIGAARAAEVGLITRAVSRDELDRAVDDLVDSIVRGGPKALAAAKQLVYEVPTLPRDEAFHRMAEHSAELFASAEAAEGIAAFREKRSARWVPSDDVSG